MTLTKKDPFKRFHRGIPPKEKSDYAYILHALETLSAKGRAVLLVSPGILFRRGAEAAIRRRLVDDNVVDAIVLLPANLFPATPVSVAILILRNTRVYEDILFVDASQRFSAGRKQHVLRHEDVDMMVEAYRRYETNEAGAVRVSRQYIRDNDYNLTVSRYWKTSRGAEADVPLLEQNIALLQTAFIETQSSLNALLGKLT